MHICRIVKTLTWKKEEGIKLIKFNKLLYLSEFCKSKYNQLCYNIIPN